VIYRVGDGVSLLSSTGSVVFLDEYATNGALVQSIQLPVTQSGGNYPFVSSGVATSEGGLSLSADGQYLLLQGYATNLSYSGTSLASSLSTIVPRVVGRADFNGNIDTSTILSNWATGNNPRSVVSTDGINIWIGGAGAGFGAGVGYTTLSSNNFTTLNVIAGGVTNKPLNVARLGISAINFTSAPSKHQRHLYRRHRFADYHQSGHCCAKRLARQRRFGKRHRRPIQFRVPTSAKRKHS